MKSEPTIEEIADDLARRRAAPRDEPQRPAFSAIPPADDGSREQAINDRIAASDKSERQGQIVGYMADLKRTRGPRYAECRLANFQCDTGPQTLAVEKLRAYAANIEAHAADGDGVFLFGPCGTGKDHLAMAIAVAFIHTLAQKVVWASGAMLFEQLRDSFDGKKSESEVMGAYRNAPLLWLSDPLPVKGELTQYQAEALYRLVDARYNAKRPCLVTANLEPGHANDTLGPAIARRLRESTLAIHCNWPGFKTGRA